jgi:hypothetical protein
MTKLRPYNLIILVIVTLLATGCFWKDDRMYPIGPGVKANLVIYFKTGVTDRQIDSFFHETLTYLDPQGHGYNHKDGVASILRLEPVQNHEALAVTFFENATEGQREQVKSAVQRSPIVYKVLENVIPKDVKKID